MASKQKSRGRSAPLAVSGGPPSFSTTLAKARKEAAGPVMVNGMPVLGLPALKPIYAGDIKNMGDAFFVRPHEVDRSCTVSPKISAPLVCTSALGPDQTRERSRQVVGFLMERSSERVLLLRKLKPTWMRGLLNGVGGKVEDGEQIISAMHREWEEELGLPDFPMWQQFATLEGCGGGKHDVYCFWAKTNKLPRDDGFNDNGEEFVTVHLSEIATRRDMVANLKWLLPLAFDDAQAQYVKAEQFR